MRKTVATIFGSIAFAIGYFTLAPLFLKYLDKFTFKTNISWHWNLFEIARRSG